MNKEDLKELLTAVSNKKLSVDKALHKLRILPFKDIEFAKIDTHRGIRRGFPEVIYCEGKKPVEVARIFGELAAAGENVLATRADKAVYSAVKKRFKKIKYYEDSRVIILLQKQIVKKGLVCVVSGGTSDSKVAEEACITAELAGANVKKIYDAGVAGMHRILAYSEWLYKANAIVVVAGMEGALPSVVAGIVDKPVIAVPTSVGYGASFKGLAPLLGMLNSCASGVSVVNIDNGFGAGYIAGLINRIAS